MAGDSERPLRADARLNHERILEAAARAFARDGAEASLKAIAQDAGVGIGTLYRRFPTRETLVEATYRNETAKLCESAGILRDALPPDRALRAWAARFLDYLATKHGMADALHAVLTSQDDLRMRTRGMLTDALDSLLSAGAADGSLRDDLPATDVLMALGGIALIAGTPAQRPLAERLLDLLLAGVRVNARPLAAD